MIDSIDLSSFIPMAVGFFCYLLSILFFMVWPKSKAKPYSKRLSWPGYILHYFHPFAWAFFGTGAMFQTSQPIFAGICIVLGVIAYIVFILMLLKA